MAKKFAKIKVKPAPDSSPLSKQLRLLADELDSLGPLLQTVALAPDLALIEAAATRLKRLVETDLIVSKEDFLACRPLWLEAWTRNAEVMESYAKKQLPRSKEASRHENEDAVAHALRLLPLCIQAAGCEAVLSTAQAALRSPATLAPRAPRVADADARKNLQTWGSMSEPEFLAFAAHVPLGAITDAAAVLGIKVTTRSAALLKKVHKAAVRFHRNTQV
jgi:hypothetical protein